MQPIIVAVIAIYIVCAICSYIALRKVIKLSDRTIDRLYYLTKSDTPIKLTQEEKDNLEKHKNFRKFEDNILVCLSLSLVPIVNVITCLILLSIPADTIADMMDAEVSSRINSGELIPIEFESSNTDEPNE